MPNASQKKTNLNKSLSKKDKWKQKKEKDMEAK